MSRPYLPGWLWNGERLVQDDTVEGCIARGAAYNASCRNAECSRRLKLELEAWLSLGYGRAPIQEVQGLYPCRRKPKCDLFWNETYPKGVPLQAYVGDKDLEIGVMCGACGLAKRYTPARLIAQFDRSGRGDGNTGINEAAQRIRGACKCGVRKWSVDVIRPDPIKVLRERNGVQGAGDCGKGSNLENC